MADDLKDGATTTATTADKAAATTGTTATTTATDTAKTTGTIVDGATTTTTTDTAKTTTDTTAATDWRSRMAGSDADALKRLARFPDEGALFKSYRALEARLSSGELKKALPDGATAEEITTWRKENGIPENEAGYVEKLALPNGLVLGDADRPIAESYAKHALNRNKTPAEYSADIAWYYQNLDEQRAKQEDADAAFRQTSEDTLRQAWEGPEYRRNLIAVQNYMADAPGDFAQQLLAGRLANGQKIGDSPEFARWTAAKALELNPGASLVPSGTTDPHKGIADELASIRKFRSEKPNDYEADKAMQKRELELIEADLKMKRRNAA